MLRPTQRQISLALSDLRIGFGDWRLWSLLGWQDIKQRYRRSTLGPLWLTISTAIQMAVMGLLGSFLFHNDIPRYLPFLCTGLLFWTMITAIVNDGATVFVSSISHLTQIRRALMTFIMQIVWRNLIIFGHNFIIYIVIALIFDVRPSLTIVLWPLGMLLGVVSVTWIALVAGILAARFRDIPMLIQSLLNIMFWVTPLVYYPEQLGDKVYLLDYNPFTHVIALMRDPLLGINPSILNWVVTAGMAVLGWGATLMFFARFRARVVYWL